MGLPSAMYSMILFMVDLSFISLARSGFTQTSAVLSISSNSWSGTRPVKVTWSASLVPAARRRMDSSWRPAANQSECTSARLRSLHDVACRLQQQDYSFLLSRSHRHSQPGICGRMPVRRVAAWDAPFLQSAGRCYYVTWVRVHAAAAGRDALIGIHWWRSRCQRSGRSSIRISGAGGKTGRAAQTWLHTIRVDVVMVENEFLMQGEVEESADQKQQIGRIAGMDRIEAARGQHLPAQEKSGRQRAIGYSAR